MIPLPNDIEIEKATLGCFLIDAQYEYVPRLRVELFYHGANREIAKVIKRLSGENIPYDLVSVTTALRDCGKLELVGGTAYVRGLVDAVVTTTSTEHYLNVLEEKFTRRYMIALAGELVEKSTNAECTTAELNVTVETMAERLVSQGVNRQKGMSEIVDTHLEHILSELDGIQGISTGLISLDKRIKGLSKKSYIIAGRPGTGKTTFAINMMLRQAEAGHRVGFISLEMSLEEILAWMLDFKLRRDHSYIPTGGTRAGWRANIQATAEALKALKIVIDDTSYADVNEVISSAYRMRYAKGIEVLYIDYMQLLEAKRSRDGSREREVAMISRRILALKKKLEIPIVTLCQLNRESTKSDDNYRPKLEHLRESGSIEQDADAVLMLYDPTRYGEKGLHEVHITKNRSGPTTHIKKPLKMHFDKPAKRFEVGAEE